jgi:hypothetical protein
MVAAAPADLTLRPTGRTASDKPTASQPPGAGNDVGDRMADHGPNRSKVAHTIIGAQMSQAALSAIAAARTAEPPPGVSMSSIRDSQRPRRDQGEPILIPTSAAPAWMVGGVVLTALALALVAGYYLLR